MFLQPKKPSKFVVFLKVILILIIAVMSMFGVLMFMVMPTETIETERITDFHGFIEEMIKDTIKPVELLYKDDITITLTQNQLTRLINGFIYDKHLKRVEIDGIRIDLENDRMLIHANITFYKIPMGIKVTGRPLLHDGNLALMVSRIDIGKLGFSSDKTVKTLLEAADDFVLSSFDRVYVSRQNNCIVFDTSKDLPRYLKVDSIAVQQGEIKVTYTIQKIKLPGLKAIIELSREELESLNIDVDDIDRVINILPNRLMTKIQRAINEYFEQ